MKEEWKNIAEYEGLYKISNFGRVYSVKNDIIMKMWLHYKGHKFLYLCKNGRKKFFVHRLVACAFIPNPDNKPLVNHIDCNKANNNVNNLEWNTDAENTQHYFAHKNYPKDDIPF